MAQVARLTQLPSRESTSLLAYGDHLSLAYHLKLIARSRCTQSCPLFHPRKSQPWVCTDQRTESVSIDGAWAQFGQRNYWRAAVLWCLVDQFLSLVYLQPSKIAVLHPSLCNTACNNTWCGTGRRRMSSRTVVDCLFPFEFYLFNHLGLRHW
jgi:hypothetical protein